MDSERRHSIRIGLCRISYIRIEPDSGAIVLDLSEDGVGFQAVAPVHRSEQVRFWFSSPIKGRFKVCGELAWTDETRKRGGLRFLGLTKDARQYVRELLAQAAVPAERRLDCMPAIASARVIEKFTGSTGGPSRSQPQTMVTIPSTVINARELATSPQSTPPECSKPLLDVCTGAILPRASLGQLRERELASRDLYEQRAQARRQQYRRGLLTGMALSALAFIGLLGFSIYRPQIGHLLLLAREELTSRNAPRASYEAVAPAVSTPNARPSGPSTRAEAVPEGQAVGITSPGETSSTDILSPSPDASIPAPARPPADKPAGSPPAPAKSGEATQASDGYYELATAEQYLSGSSMPRNSRTAARWLWAAVKKGNVAAEIALSDLYVAGEGVDKNCEQARILLQAATKTGNATAAAKLDAADKYGLCRALQAYSSR